MFRVTAQDDLRVRFRTAISREVSDAGEEILEVVGFAVVGDAVARFGIEHRLMTSAGSINDREACVAECELTVIERPSPDALIIRPAVSLRSVHARNRLFHCAGIEVRTEDAGDTTHAPLLERTARIVR